MTRWRGRGALAALGVFLAAAMAATAVTVAIGLSGGFDRTADRADLPDVTASFDRHDAADVLRRARALPNVAAAALRYEVDKVEIAANDHFSRNGGILLVDPGRRGYAIVAGRDVLDGSESDVVVEAGVARAWHLRLGATIFVGRLPLRIVGLSLTPDNVAFPLATVPRVYVSAAGIRHVVGARGPPHTTELLLWVHDRGRLDVTLAQARESSAGLSGLTILTRGGVRVLVDGAAGIVVALLAAFSLVALGSAALMLAASAQSAVRRRLPVLGVMRAAGATRASLARAEAAAAARRGALPAVAGTLAGWLVARSPVNGLLATLNEVGPGAGLGLWLAGSWGAVVAVIAVASAWPAWRATHGPPARLLRGAELSAAPARRGVAPWPVLVGARAIAARRARLVLSAAVVASAAAVVVLMVAMASLLSGLRNDPGSLGRRYQLTANLPPSAVPQVAALPGVDAVSPRYAVEAADSFHLGETVRVIAFPGDHTRFEAPPLASGRRLAGPGEAEVGTGLADVLGLRPGSTLALQLPTGREARFRVSGIVRSLEADGRVAYVQPLRLLRAIPDLGPGLAIRVGDRNKLAAVSDGLRRLGATPRTAGGATSNNQALLSTLATVLRAVAAVNGFVCLYAILAALALVAGERVGLVALLRAGGARRSDVVAVFAGAAGLLVAVAAPAALLAERFALGPIVAHLAASYASLSLRPSAATIALTAGGLSIVGLLAAVVITQRALAAPVVAGLREVE